jgi:hypothetical protein
MYDTWPELVDGYTKSLWASFGSAAGAFGVVAMLVALFVVPVLGLVAAPVAGAGSIAFIGMVGYAAGVLSRAVAARATGARAWPDALGHPASIVLFGWLVARSFRRRRSVTWKGRQVTR